MGKKISRTRERESQIIRTSNAVFLEDFDIRGLYKERPQLKVGVKKGVVCCQIAIFSGNPKRKKELKILCDALENSKSSNYKDNKYTTLSCADIMKCFKNQLNTLPKTTFIECESIEG